MKLEDEKDSSSIASPKVDVESTPSQEPLPPSDFPDGGLEAWVSLAGSFMVVFCTSGFGVYQDFYTRQYLTNFSSSQISWIGSVQAFGLFSIGTFSGYAMDAGHFRILTFIGSILLVFCLFMSSFVNPGQWYPLFLAQGIGFGLAAGLLYIPALSVVAHHFKRRRALAMGIASAAASLGGIVHPIMLNQLIHGPVGFAWAVRISTLLNLVLLAAANLMMKTRIPVRKSQTFSQLFAFWRGFFTDVAYIAACAGNLLFVLGLFFPMYFIQLESIERGVSETLSFYLIAIFYVTSAIGRILPTLIVHKTGTFNLIVPCTVVCSILIYCLSVTVVNAAGAVVMSLLCGFFSGVCISLLGPMTANFARDVSEVGARVGLAFGVGGIGGLVGPPITGALLTSHNYWIRPAAFCGTCVCLGACLFAFAGLWRRKVKARVTETEKSKS